ncbi:MAG: NAD(P)-dependent alcohol dehydrogenase [Candidatus Odinarchaeota archaeon]
MRAVVVAKYGPPEGLQIRDVEKPVPRNNEILVKIYATTVTYGDAKLRSFSLPIRLLFGLFSFRLGKNKILGHEFSGEIEEIGRDVTLFKPDDRVFASAGVRGGAHAEYICIPEDSMVAIKPDNITFEEAAAVPIGGNTALYILQKANIVNGQKVLVYGASGSVGSYAIQLAKFWGAEVTGVCSTKNLEWVRNLGADHVIDYTKSNFTDGDKTYDVIFDAVRKISSSQCKKLLDEKGVFLSTSSSTEEKVENLVFLKELIEARKLKPVIDRQYLLEEIAEAHRYVDKGHKQGNVVVTITSSRAK